MRRYLLYALAYGGVGVIVGLAMAYYTKDTDVSLLINPDGTGKVVRGPTPRVNAEVPSESSTAREE